jgi:hypothetical protein
MAVVAESPELLEAADGADLPEHRVDAAGGVVEAALLQRSQHLLAPVRRERFGVEIERADELGAELAPLGFAGGGNPRVDGVGRTLRQAVQLDHEGVTVVRVHAHGLEDFLPRRLRLVGDNNLAGLGRSGNESEDESDQGRPDADAPRYGG